MKLRALLCALAMLAAAIVTTTTTAGALGGRHQHDRSTSAMPRASSAETRKLRRRAAARKAWLRSPKAGRQRRRSRTAYRGASHGAALGILRNHFQGVVDEPVYHGLRLDAGERVSDYLGDNIAVISLPGTTERAVAQSTVPLVTSDASGQKVPVDLRLERHGRHLEPKAPFGRTSIADDARGGFTLGDAGVTVHPDAPPTADGSVVADKLFFTDIAADTDLLEMPVATGVETFNLLRSSASPEDIAVSVEMPAGAELRPVPGPTGLPDGAQIVRGGHPLVDIPAPVAQDADGVKVPASYRIEGNRLTVHVAHRSGSFRYPLLVDPNYVQDGTTGGTGFAGWHFIRNNTGYDYYIGNTTYKNFGVTRYGLTIQVTGTVNQGNFGNWYWTAPAGSYIYRADWEYVTYEWLYEIINEGITRNGVWEPTNSPHRQISSNVNHEYFGLCFGPPCTQVPDGAREGLRDGNSMIFGMEDPYGTLTFPTTSPLKATMEGADVFLNDQHSPVIDSFSQSAGSAWHDKDISGVDVVYSSHDVGLGLWQHTLDGPGTADYSYQLCNSGKINEVPPCPISQTGKSLTYPLSALDEGVSNIDFYATDIVNHPSLHQSFQVKVDRQPPALSATGPLKNAVDQKVSGDLDLNLNSTDGVDDGNLAHSRSGALNVEVKVDGQRAFYDEKPSPCDNCAISGTWTFHSEDYDPGEHTITVDSSDQAHHPSPTQTWKVYNDPTTPDLSVGGSLWDADGQTVTSGVYDLTVSAADGDSTDPSTGIKSVLVDVDGNQKLYDAPGCSAGNCELEENWDFVPADYTEGPHTITVTTTDVAGNWDSDQVTVYVARVPATAAQTIDLGAQQSVPDASQRAVRADGAAPGDGAGQSTADIGDVNGDGIDDFAIGAPGADNNLRTDSGSVYIVYGNSSATSLDLGSLGSAGFRIDGADAFDLAGTAVAPAGDVNGDGIADIQIGAPGRTGSLKRAQVYVVFGAGQPTGNVDLAALGTSGFAINGPLLSAPGTGDPVTRRFGAALSGPRLGDFQSASDVNGDDLDDIVIGSSDDATATRPGGGTTYVVFGKANGTPVDVDTLGSQGFKIDGAAIGDHSGTAAAIVGEVSGDANADIVVTAPDATNGGRPNSGTAYVVYGKSDSSTVDLAALGTSGYPIYGPAEGRLGSTATSLGDVDDDGYGDFALGGHGAWVLTPTYPDGNPVDLASQFDGYAVAPPSGSGYDQAVVGSSGDLNADGVADLLVGFPQAGGSRTQAGESYAVLSRLGDGVPTGTVDLTALPGEAGSKFLGVAATDSSGTSLAGGDPDETEQQYVAIGAPGASANSRPKSGSAYLVPSNSMSSNQQASAAREPYVNKRCWRHPRQTHDWNGKIDPCRRTLQGNTDKARRTPRGGYKNRGYRDIARGNSNGGNAHRTPRSPKLSPNPGVDNERLWRLKDSLGGTVGWIKFVKSHRYALYQAETQNNRPTTKIAETKSNSQWSLHLSGRGCMSTEALEDTHALVYMGLGEGADGGAKRNQTDTGKNPFVRAYIDRSAFPAEAFRQRNRDGTYRHRNNGQYIDSYSVPCYKTAYRHKERRGGVSVPMPGFLSSERYLNRTGGMNGYHNYQSPHYIDGVNNQGNRFPDLTYGNHATTAVVRGGIVQAVIPPGTYRVEDEIGAPDGNIPCPDPNHGISGEAVARWLFINANPGGRALFTWVPTRERSGHMRPCGP